MTDYFFFQSNYMNMENKYYLKGENPFHNSENSFTISENCINDLNNIETYKSMVLNNTSLDVLRQIWNTKIYQEEDDTDGTIRNKNIFKVLSAKRGRRQEGKRKKEHNKHSLDNILSKIQVHFLSFLINLVNDALKAEFGEKTFYNFKNLPHKFKKKVDFNSFYSINNCMIKDLLKI